MTFYFICQDQKYFQSFTKRFSFLEDGVFVESIEHLREILKVNTEDQQFFLVHFQGIGTKTDKYIVSIREKRPNAKVVFVAQQMSSAQLKSHQTSEVGADVYVDFSVTELVFGEILDNFLPPELPSPGARTERTGVFARKFEEIDHLQELREHTQSKQLNEIFTSVIVSSKAMAPTWQSTATLQNPQTEEEKVGADLGEHMSDKDHELSLENLEDLEVGGESEDPGSEAVLDDGFDLDDGAPDIPLDLEEESAPVEPNEESDYGTIEAAPEPKGTSSELYFTDVDEELADEEFSSSEDEDLGFEDDDALLETEEPLIENLGELDFSDISDISLDVTSANLKSDSTDEEDISSNDIGDFSEDAKEKLKEIDAIMDLDASQTQLSRERLEGIESDPDDDLALSLDEEDGGFGDLSETPDMGEFDDLGDLDSGAVDEPDGETDFGLALNADLESGEGVGGDFIPVDGTSIDGLEFDTGTLEDQNEDRTGISDTDRTMIAPKALVAEARAQKPKADPEPAAVARLEPQTSKAHEPEDRTPVFTGDYERAQATISNLRADREELLAKIQQLEDDRVLQGRQQLSLRAELDEKKIELTIIRKKLNTELADLKEKLGLMEERKLLLEEKVKFLSQELDKAGQKNKIDVKKVQMRERELEQKLELLKSDAETQIRNRDSKILELKRKIDAMEFDMESISLQEKKSVENRFELEDKLEKAIKTLRSAITVLEEDGEKSNALDALKKNIEM